MSRAVPALAGRLSRAAVFVAGASGCWTGNTPSQESTTPVENHATEPPVQAVDASAGSARLRGTITDAVTHKPLAGVVVELAHTEGFWTATTDASGRFAIVHVPAGDYTVSFRSPDGQRYGQSTIANVGDGMSGTVDMAIDVNSYMPVAKPYGAPPARRRVV